MLNGIAQALGGFSAGLQGRGDEYSAAMDQREAFDRQKKAQDEQLSTDRLKAMVQDAYGVKTLLDSGKTSAALKLLQNRIEHISKLGGNPQDTKAIYDQLVSGDPAMLANAHKTLSDVVDAGAAGGLWAPPQESLESKKFTAQQEQFKQEQALRERAQTWKEQHPNEGNANNPYFQFIPTSEGLAVGNARTGAVNLAQGSGGGNLMPIAADVGLKGRMSAAGAAGETQGKSTAQANIDLPKVESGAQKVKFLVNELIKHPGKESALGMSSYLPSIRGTERAAFDNRLAQLQGNTFLNAFESLKGGGQITEIEGAKAQAALNRMNNTVDSKEFDAAAKDFTSEIDRLAGIAKQRATGKTETKKTGGVLHVDAAGNKAMVYPDGSYEEVQ